MGGGFVVIALVLQALALALLFRRLGRRWLVHAGAVFIVLATTYHGLNEIFLWLFPNRDPYRLLISPEYVAQFVVWVSVAILLFTLVYLAVLKRQQERPEPGEREKALTRRVFSWPLLLAVGLPAIIVSLAAQPAGAEQGLIHQFFLLVVPLMSVMLIARLGRRLFLPIVLAQSLVIAVSGERLAILVAIAVVLYALARLDISVGRRSLALAGATLIMSALVVTSARASLGRDNPTSFGFLASGIGGLLSTTTGEAVAADFGYRLDGNSFGAMELEAIGRWHQPTLGFRPVFNDLLLAIPSFLNPTKTSSAIEQRSDKEYAEVYLGLPLPFLASGAHQDILPTQFGGIVGFAGPWGLLLAAVLLGISFALADRWLLRSLSPSRLLLGIGLFSCALFYEGSWDRYPLVFRGILLLLPIVWTLQSRQHATSRNDPYVQLERAVERTRATV